MRTTYPTRNVEANIHVEHTQLRDLISCPSERGDIIYASTSGLSARNLNEAEPVERVVPGFGFAPTCVATGSGLVAAGGVHADLFLAPLSAIPPSTASIKLPPNPPEEKWAEYARMPGSINNSLFFTNLALGSSPYHLPTAYDAIADTPRLVVGNNDCTLKLYNIATRVNAAAAPFLDEPCSASHKMRRSNRFTMAGLLRLKTCVNHASISPNGRTMLVVGDTPSVYLYNLNGGENITFDHAHTYEKAFTDAAFSTAWSTDGMRYAAASQDGVVKVWDVRSTNPLYETRAIESARRRKPSRSSSSRSPSRSPGGTRFPSGLTAPLADGTQYMSHPSDASSSFSSSVTSLFGRATPAHFAPATLSFIDASGHFSASSIGGFTSSSSHVPSYATIPDKEMNMVAPAVRTLKFMRSGGQEILAFTEHLNHVHIVDAETFSEHLVIRVPPAGTASPSPSMCAPPVSSFSRSPVPHSDAFQNHQYPPALQIPPASASQHPRSGWCTPVISPLEPRPPQQWSTQIPSVQVPMGLDERDGHSILRGAPSLYADIRGPISSRGFVASGVSGVRYEFMTAPSQRLSAQEGSDCDEGEEEDGELRESDDREEQAAAAWLDWQSAHSTRHHHPVAHMRAPSSSSHPPQAPLPISAQAHSHLPMPSVSVSSASSSSPSHTSSSSASSNVSNNISIAHHPATRTRRAYDEKHGTTHLSGLTFDPSGRWMYVSTEKSIVEWDLREVLGGTAMGMGARPSRFASWGRPMYETVSEWA